MKPQVERPSPSFPITLVSHPQLEVARLAAVNRCIERAQSAASRLSFTLSNVREATGASATLSGPVSAVLDEFVGNVRTAAEICAHTTEQQDDRIRIERTLAQLGGLYVSQHADMTAGRIAPGGFMQAADSLAATAQRDLAALHAEFERHGQSVRDAVGDRQQQLH